MKIRNKTERQLREREMQQQKLEKYTTSHKSYDCYRQDRLTQTQNNDILFLTRKINRLTKMLEESFD